MSHDVLWQEVAALRERMKQIEMNSDLLTRGLEQRLAAYDRLLGIGAPATQPAPVRVEGD